MTLYLCGFMGCGKTTVGKALASKLHMTYTDMDSFIVQCERMSIANIFSSMGESYFRQRETLAIGQLGDLGGIIACGGGAMLKEENARIASEKGKIVYIDTPFDVCYRRIEGDTSRPLVVSNSKQSLEDLYNTRKKLYEANSTFTVKGTGSPDEIADSIISLLK